MPTTSSTLSLLLSSVILVQCFLHFVCQYLFITSLLHPPSSFFFFFFMIPPPPRSTLFPYTTLFRSFSRSDAWNSPSALITFARRSRSASAWRAIARCIPCGISTSFTSTIDTLIPHGCSARWRARRMSEEHTPEPHPPNPLLSPPHPP